VRVFAPRCPKARDLEPSLAPQVSFLDQTLQSVGLELVHLEQPSAHDVFQAASRVSDGWFWLSYTGHADRNSSGPTELCLEPAPGPPPASCRAGSDRGKVSINECLLGQLSSSLSGAVLLLDACQSAQVDPRRSPVPTSIISSSPYVVDADSLFGNRLALALNEAASDPNCDGLVTDQELFDALLHLTYSEVSLAARRSYPKLRRNAPSHIPLPVRARDRGMCRGMRDRIRELARHDEPSWKGLTTALRAQLALEPFPKVKARLPESPCDYFVVAADAENPVLLKTAAMGAGLCEFPSPDVQTAREVAKFASFAEVYLLSNCCGWSRVIRLRDDYAMAVRRDEALGAALPARVSVSARRTLDDSIGSEEREKCQIRYFGEVPLDNRTLVHCSEPDGQCFMDKCPERK
jgi:hypothetical protein